MKGARFQPTCMDSTLSAMFRQGPMVCLYLYFCNFQFKFTIPGKQVVLISINCIPKSSHSCLNYVFQVHWSVWDLVLYFFRTDGQSVNFPVHPCNESEVPTSPWLWMDTFATTPAFASCSFHCAAASDQHRPAGWSEGRSFHCFFFRWICYFFLPG